MSSRGKTQEKNIWAQIWVKGANVRPEIRFFLSFSQI